MVTDLQVRRLFAMKNKVKYLYQLADKTGMSTKTVRKYLKSGSLPSQCKAVHDWATPIRMHLPRTGPGLKTSSKTTLLSNPNHFLRLFSVSIPANTRMANSALSRDE